MGAHKTVLFDKCPLCGQAKITMEKPRWFHFFKLKIDPCYKCSAEFVAKDADNYQLVFCEPQKLVGKHSCRDRIFRGCYLDATLSKYEWQKVAQGSESYAFSDFFEMSEKFRRGLLPNYIPEQLPFSLERNEIFHLISSPVYLDDKRSTKGTPSDKGDFFLTNKRIVFVYPLGTLTIPLDNVELVEDSPPGFFVKEKGSFEFNYFFPPSCDPVFAAVYGALRNFKGEGSKL